MPIDPVRPAIWIGCIAALIGAICLGYVAYSNLSSRNIGLGFGAFVGACVIGMTLFFDLKRSSSTEDIGATVVLDYQSNSIQLYTTDLMHSRSIFIASEASKILPKPNKGEDRVTQSVSLARDFAILTIISYLLNEQADWQMDRSTYRTAVGANETWRGGVSAPSECSTIQNAEVRKRLKDIGNAFAEVEQISLGNRDICLPPNSLMEIAPDHVTITTPVCEIAFVLQEQFLLNMSTYPGGTSAPPAMFEGASRYSTTTLGIRVTSKYFALRAQDRFIDKYRGWAMRVVSRARIWLEGPTTAS